MGDQQKKRVFQVARELNISNEALLEYLKEMKFDVRNHMSLLTDDMLQASADKFSYNIEIPDKEKDFDFKRELKERRAREEEKKREEHRKYEEKVRASEMIRSVNPGRRKATPKVSPKKAAPPEKKRVEEPPVVKPPKSEKETIRMKPPQEIPVSRIVKKDEEKISIEAEEAVKELIGARKLEKAERETREGMKARPSAEPKKVTPPVKERIEDKKKERPESEVERILKAKEKKEEISTVETEKKKERKKLKAKDRLAEIEKQAKEEGRVGVKKKKKRKRVRSAEEPQENKQEKIKKRAKKKKKIQISDEEVEESIRQTLALIEDAGKGKRRRKKTKVADEISEEDDNTLRVHEFLSVGELASEMEVEPSIVIKKCMELGTLVSINQRLDEATILAVADEFGYAVELVPEFGSDKFEEIEDRDEEKSAEPRPPVVTIMGHVDHGKTSLLDYIRESSITSEESGGITQHIGAYEVMVNAKSITFLDTPGHEAFAAMRARGAQVTDIVILVVAADDAVMPQTIEAINHAKAANVPIVVAINKIDKSNADPERIKKQLADHGVLIESWGGKSQSVEISAKTGLNINKLLDSILVEAEILELKANPNRSAKGVVIESRLDKGKGIIATVLVQKGSLKVGDPFIAGQYSGKVRSLFNHEGLKLKSAGPSVPVQVIGFDGLPQAGDNFMVLGSEKDTKAISFSRQQIRREQDFRKFKHLTLDEISRRIRDGQVRELSIILKGDVDGSVEAISDSLTKLSNAEVAVRIIHQGVGAISESDVLLAIASEAVILGFQVRPTIKARDLAKRDNIDIRMYSVIYDAISDVKDALEGLLEPEFQEVNLSVIEVRDTFRVPKIGMVAGCYVMSGKVTRNDKAKLFRDDKLVHDGKIASLKRFKDDVKEVAGGFECGLSFEGFDDIKVKDIIETYKIDVIKRKLTFAN